MYMDDLIIPSKNHKEAIDKLDRVLKVAAKSGLRFKWKKCKLLSTRVEFLGNIIENGQISPAFDKVKAVANFPEPTNVRRLQSFLGLTGYFRKFIPSYSLVAQPLTDLLRKDVPFLMGGKQKQAIQALKTILVEKPVLALYQTSAETELHTDASKYGYGAILMQRGEEDGLMHPVYY